MGRVVCTARARTELGGVGGEDRDRSPARPLGRCQRVWTPAHQSVGPPGHPSPVSGRDGLPRSALGPGLCRQGRSAAVSRRGGPTPLATPRPPSCAPTPATRPLSRHQECDPVALSGAVHRDDPRLGHVPLPRDVHAGGSTVSESAHPARRSARSTDHRRVSEHSSRSRGAVSRWRPNCRGAERNLERVLRAGLGRAAAGGARTSCAEQSLCPRRGNASTAQANRGAHLGGPKAARGRPS